MKKALKEIFANAAKRLQEIQAKESYIHLSHSPDPHQDSSFTPVGAGKQTQPVSPAAPQYETYEHTEQELTKITGYERQQHGYGERNTILSLDHISKEVGKLPRGYTWEEVLDLFAKAHPEHVVIHGKTGAVRIRQDDAVYLHRFLKELEDNERLKHSLTADAILQQYLFDKDISDDSLDKKIHEFAKENPDSVTSTKKKVTLADGKIRNKRVYAIDIAVLQDFFKFADLKPSVDNEMPIKKIEQPEIDPTAPDYKSDPTLQAISDQDMDIIASRLAEQTIVDVEAANDAILAEIKNISSGYDDR